MRKLILLSMILAMCSVAKAQQKQVLSAASSTCSTTSCLSVSVDQTQGGSTFTITANASGNTVQFEASGDGGTTWVALNATPSNSTTAVTSSSSTGTWQANVAGYTNIRMRMSALVGGTTTVSMIQSTASARAGGGGGGGGGGTVTGTGAATQVAFWSSPTAITGDPNLTYIAASPNQQFLLGCTPQSVDMSESCGNAGVVGTVTGNSTFGDLYGWQNNALITINSPNTTSTKYIGLSSTFDGEGSGTFTDTVLGQVGIQGTSSYGADSSNPAGSAALLVGVEGQAQNQSTTGTVTTLIGVEAANASNAGTVINNYGIDGGAQNGVGSTLNAAFFAPDQGTGANDYAMYLAGGKLHSAGAIDSNSSISANSDGVHAGEVALLGQTTAPAIPANSFGFIGPNSASFTSWFIQPTSTAPAAQCIVSLAAASSNISALTCPTTVPVANGGTALATLTAHALYVGNGASAPNAVSVGATGTVLAGSTGADPAFTATPAVTSIATGTSPPTCTIGTAGVLCENEGTAPTAASGVDMLYADSTAHCSTIINQTANIGCSVGVQRAVMVADWTCGTTGTVSSCVAATIIGSGGGTPLTITLPSAALSWDWDCDLVVGQATGATANNWNMLTATNGATNVTVDYMQGDSATTFGGGSTTDQGSTTTTFNIGGAWTLGGTGTKMPVHIHGRIEGASASGTVVSLQLVAPTVGDLVTIYRGASCTAHN